MTLSVGVVGLSHVRSDSLERHSHLFGPEKTLQKKSNVAETIKGKTASFFWTRLYGRQITLFSEEFDTCSKSGCSFFVDAPFKAKATHGTHFCLKQCDLTISGGPCRGRERMPLVAAQEHRGECRPVFAVHVIHVDASLSGSHTTCSGFVGSVLRLGIRYGTAFGHHGL